METKSNRIREFQKFIQPQYQGLHALGSSWQIEENRAESWKIVLVWRGEMFSLFAKAIS